jgi:thiaminase
LSHEFSREVRKLEVRLEDYVRADREFVEHSEECIILFKKLAKKLKSIGKTSSPEKIKGLSNLRRKAMKSLALALNGESSIAHERSHIFESYGALILSLEKELENLES